MIKISRMTSKERFIWQRIREIAIVSIFKVFLLPYFPLPRISSPSNFRFFNFRPLGKIKSPISPPLIFTPLTDKYFITKFPNSFPFFYFTPRNFKGFKFTPSNLRPIEAKNKGRRNLRGIRHSLNIFYKLSFSELFPGDENVPGETVRSVLDSDRYNHVFNVHCYFDE